MTDEQTVDLSNIPNYMTIGYIIFVCDCMIAFFCECAGISNLHNNKSLNKSNA